MRFWGYICSNSKDSKNSVSPSEDKNVTNERIRVRNNKRIISYHNSYFLENYQLKFKLFLILMA